MLLPQMPAVRAAATMEYFGVAVKVGRLMDMRREVDQRLTDLCSLAEQVVAGCDELEVFRRVRACEGCMLVQP